MSSSTAAAFGGVGGRGALHFRMFRSRGRLCQITMPVCVPATPSLNHTAERKRWMLTAAMAKGGQDLLEAISATQEG
jgi:hypothetical protein